MSQHKRIFFPNLDGLRFFAFFSVFLFHSFFTKNPAIQENQVFAALRWLTRPGDIGVPYRVGQCVTAQYRVREGGREAIPRAGRIDNARDRFGGDGVAAATLEHDRALT